MAEPEPARRPGRPQDAQKEAAIMGAAQALFLEKGFDGVSVEAIATRAGVAKATVYARFGDKEALLRAAIRSKCAAYLDGGTLGWKAGRSLRRGLIDIARQFLALVTDPEALAMHRLIMQEAERGPHLPNLFFECAILPTMRRFADYLEAEVQTGRLRVDDPAGAAWRFFGMVKGIDHMRAMFGLPARPAGEIEAHLAACADTFIAAHRV